MEEERERLKLVREEERNDPTKVPHKFYQVSDVTMWYGAVCDRGHVLGLELNKNDLEEKFEPNTEIEAHRFLMLKSQSLSWKTPSFNIGLAHFKNFGFKWQ